MFDGDLRLLIVDDEAPARSRLRDMISAVGGWHVAGEAETGEAALALCEELEPDVVLLDIRMPGMDGIEVAARLADAELPPAVVFTTAYDEYAIKAFDANAIGYLLKPVRRERLLRALERAAQVSRWQLRELRSGPAAETDQATIAVPEQGGIRQIPLASVSAFLADQKYVRMVHAQGESLLDDSLKSLSEQYARDFVRLHRKSLVRVSLIEAFTRAAAGHYEVRLRGWPESLPVSRRHVSTVKARLA